MNPEELFANFQRTRDPEPLGAVFDLVADDLYRVALHLAPDRAVAEDLVQQTFLQAIQSASRYDVAQPLRPWLLGILHNKARRRRLRPALEVSEHVVSQESPPIEIVLAEETAAEVARGLRSLPQPYREVLELRLMESVSNADIAERLGRSPGAIRNQVWRGLRMLREVLPKSLAVGLGVQTLQQPGLAAVRARVLGAARAPTGVLASVAAVGAVSLWTVVAVVVLVVAGAVAFGLGSDQPVAASTPGGVAVEGEERQTARGTRRDAARSLANPSASVSQDAVQAPEQRGAAASGVVRVLVLDPNGQAVEDARVEVFAPHRYLDKDGAWRTGATRARTGSALATAATDGSGRATLGVVLPMGAKHLFVHARKAGVGSTGDILLRRPRPDASAETRLVVHRPIRVTGVVVLANGQPGAGAKVYVRKNGISRPGEPAPPLPMTADESGRFGCELTPCPHEFVFRAKVDEQFSPSVRVDLGAGLRDRKIELQFPGAFSIRGALLDAKGRPVAGRVSLHPVAPRGGRPSARQRVGADGQFVFLLAAGGSYHLVGGGDGHSATARQVTLSAGAPHQTVRLDLGPLAEVSGRVVDERGRPQAGVFVGLSQASRSTALLRAVSGANGMLPRGETAADGSFRFMAPAGHRFRIGLRPVRGTELYVFKRELTPPAVGLSVTLTPSDRRGVQIRGVVVAAGNGKPIERFTVRRLTHSSPSSASIGGPTEFKDPQGRFAIGPLRPGKRYGVQVDAEGYAPSWTAPLDAEVWTHDVRLELQRFGRLRCSVVRADGKPLPDARVWLESTVRRPFARSHAGDTDGSGVARLGDVPPGAYRVHAQRKGGRTRGVEKSVTVVAGKEVPVQLTIED